MQVTNPQWQVFRKLKTKYKSSQLFEKHYSCRRPFCSLHPDLYVLWPDRIFFYNLGGSFSSIVLSNFLLWSLGGQVYNILTNLMKSSRTILLFLPDIEQLVKKANLSLATSHYPLHLNLVHLKLVWNWKFSAFLPFFPFQFLLTRSRLSLWVRRRVRPPTVRYLPSFVRSTCIEEFGVVCFGHFDSFRGWCHLVELWTLTAAVISPHKPPWAAISWHWRFPTIPK